MFHWLIHKVHYDTHARLLVLFTFAGILRYLNSVIHVTSMDSYSTTILLAESLFNFNYLSPQLTTFTVLEWFSLNLVIESCFYGDEFTVSRLVYNFYSQPYTSLLGKECDNTHQDKEEKEGGLTIGTLTLWEPVARLPQFDDTSILYSPQPIISVQTLAEVIAPGTSWLKLSCASVPRLNYSPGMAQRCNSSHRKAAKMITLEANSYTLSLTFDIGPVSLTGTGTLPGLLKMAQILQLKEHWSSTW